jgi:hypothetical protein
MSRDKNKSERRRLEWLHAADGQFGVRIHWIGGHAYDRDARALVEEGLLTMVRTALLARGNATHLKLTESGRAELARLTALLGARDPAWKGFGAKPYWLQSAGEALLERFKARTSGR